MISLSGIMKHFQILLMRLIKLLLDKLVSFWDQDVECFIIQEERIEITLLDIYFLLGYLCWV